MRPRQNGRRFADDTFKRIFLNENVRISIKISLKFVPKGPINNNPALVQKMAWRRSGDKPLSEPIVYWRIYASLGLNELRTWKKFSSMAAWASTPQMDRIITHHWNYRKVSNIRRTKCQNLNDSRLVLQLSVTNPLMPSVKSITQM